MPNSGNSLTSGEIDKKVEGKGAGEKERKVGKEGMGTAAEWGGPCYAGGGSGRG